MRLSALLLAMVLLGDTRRGGPWLRDFDQAAEQAKREHKHLLVEFSGSDWNARSQELRREVLDDPGFLAAFEGRYLAVTLDFPTGAAAKALVPAPERNRELQLSIDLRVFPALFLMTPSGRIYGEIGYRMLSAERYTQRLLSIESAGRAALEGFEALAGELASSASALEQAAVLERIASWAEVTAADRRVSARLVREGLSLLTRAFELDSDGRQGLARRCLAVCLSQGYSAPEIHAAAADLDGNNLEGWFEASLSLEFEAARDPARARVFCLHLERFLQEHKRLGDPLGVARLAAQAAFWNADPELLDDSARASGLAQQALSIAPQAPFATALRKLLEALGSESSGE